jgi:eukaryotic-like serine/threonine-protein kinase
MGEVYRARDTKLQRDVALKILPETMARDAQRMARFEREAQVLASLNHPNIAAIYGLEESNGVRALVMELVEGETLGEKIVGEGSALPREPKGLPYDEALPIAKQIAEALEYAHERGVIHRDLKPANVKITPEGTVKVLDFGLAKVLDTQDSSTTMDMANSPTLSAMATQAGMILGTAAYMSPEQAKGQPVDRRADIWAFGCVLYEMLAGRKPFEGATISDVLAAVIRAEPEWTAIPETTPQAIKKLVYRCLQKDQRQRLQAIGEARITIEETISCTGVSPVDVHGQDAHATATDQKSPLRRGLPWAGMIVLAIVAAVLAIGYVARAPKQQPVTRFSVVPPENATLLGDGEMSLSPDGRKLAFVMSPSSGQPLKLWVRPLDSLTAKPLQGTEGAHSPFWSPDGNELGFYANGKLEKVAVSGGTPTLVAAPDQARDEAFYVAPQFLPDGRHFLFVILPAHVGRGKSIGMSTLDSKKVEHLAVTSSNVFYAPPGYLLYMNQATLMARPFDAEGFKFTGQAVPIAQGVASQMGFGHFTVSQTGALAYGTGGSATLSQMVWVNRKGEKLETVGQPGVYTSPALSPNATKLAVGVGNHMEGDLWVYDLKRGTASRLTFNPAGDEYPV